MKLKESQVDQVLDQLPAEVIPDDHPTVAQLETVFGPHTFFIGSEGLHVVERGVTHATASRRGPPRRLVLSRRRG